MLLFGLNQFDDDSVQFSNCVNVQLCQSILKQIQTSSAEDIRIIIQLISVKVLFPLNSVSAVNPIILLNFYSIMSFKPQRNKPKVTSAKEPKPQSSERNGDKKPWRNQCQSEVQFSSDLNGQ